MICKLLIDMTNLKCDKFNSIKLNFSGIICNHKSKFVKKNGKFHTGEYGCVRGDATE